MSSVPLGDLDYRLYRVNSVVGVLFGVSIVCQLFTDFVFWRAWLVPCVVCGVLVVCVGVFFACFLVCIKMCVFDWELFLVFLSAGFLWRV